MARQRESHIRRQITSLISPQLIRRRGRDLGVVQRQRKVDIVAFVYTLILGFAASRRRSLAGLRRAYTLATGTTLASSAFQDRFTPALAELMKQLTERAFEKLSRGSTRMCLALRAFTRVFIVDGSLIRLADALEHDYPSVWTNHTKASAKLHLVVNAKTRTPTITRIVPGCQHDLNLMTTGSWCREALLVFDLAYYQGRLFQRIMDIGGSFLCRVKKDANFVVLRATAPRFIGKRTKDILRKMRGRSFECAVDYMHRNIPQRDWTQNHIDLRLVAIWNRQRKCHQQYLSNVSADQLAAADMPAVYAMRWEIELLFRELKSQLRIDQIPSGHKAAADAFIYAALLVLAIGRKLHRALQCRGKGIVDRFPFERWSSILRQVASDLLHVLLAPASQSHTLSRRLALLLRYEGKDPNRHRLLLKARAQLGVLAC